MKSISILGLLVLATMAATVASGQTPILQYTFNETGTTAASTGLNPTPLTFLNASGTATDLHSAYGLGVSGQIGDRAFDNTASTGMGIGSVGGLAGIPAGTVGTLSSFTYQCWFNVATPITNLARLLEDTHISIEALNGGVVMHVNGKFVTTAAAWSGTGEWVFFAVSYDGTRSSDNLTFYTGTKTSPVTQAGSPFTLDGGPVLQDHPLTFGNYNNGPIRPLDGYMDDVRIYGSPTDSSGVLTVAQLEAIRERDLRNEIDVLDNDIVSISGSIIQETGTNGSTAIDPITTASVLKVLGYTNTPPPKELGFYFDKTTQSYVVARRVDAYDGFGTPLATVFSPGDEGVNWQPGKQSSIAAYAASGLNDYLTGTGLANGILLGGVETDTINSTLFGTISGIPTIMKCTVVDVFDQGSPLGAL